MKKNMLSALALMLGMLPAQAQQVEFLGDNQSLVRINTNNRYLLIPVQERAEMAHVRVVKNNQLAQTFNVRLAVDKIDYFVPLDLNTVSGEAVLQVKVPAQQHVNKAFKDYSCWTSMKYSDTFDSRNVEKFRPAYHHSPVYGWMNDPNGLFYKDGVWHLYYQWNPYGSQWENMTWGHSTSTDGLHWTPQPTAIEADALGAIFSGCCVVDKNNTAGFGNGAIVAYYTSAGARQTQSMAYSVDGGQTFTKYAGNPVIVSDVPDFRDPHIFWNEEAGFWNMVLASGQEMSIYSSKDLKQWKHESNFGLTYGNHSGVWECPDLMKLPVDGTGEQKWMLICNINPGGPFGGSATQYFIGQFDGHQFVCEDQPEETKWMDYGKDHYATVTFDNAPDGRRVAIAWMSNWQYANQVPTMQFRSANSILRDLSLYQYEGETYCAVRPAKEMDAARGKKIARPTDRCEIVVTLKGDARITLSNGSKERVVLDYDADMASLDFDRRHSGQCSFSDAFPTVVTAPVHGSLRTLRIFIDKSSIEVFDADGRLSMTNLVFPSSPYNRISVKGKASAKIYEIK
ncbi:MAG: DUF4980 domain-containing protein [Bacteroidales bacterium]|nr:DUF4980 domain-containing protein [Bacteroidales bacterium]